MLRSCYNPGSRQSFTIQLLERIHRLQFQEEQNKYLTSLKSPCLLLLLIFSILCVFQYPNRIYNAWHGPFHLNLNEFITHWNVYSGNAAAGSWFSFNEEYLQIELGEDKIDVNPKNIFRIYYRHPTYDKVLYTFNPIKEPKITTVPMQLFVKLPTSLESYFHKRLPYRFELFNADTLKCIAQQIDVDQLKFENSMYIQLIEEIYDRNATDFNMKVIIKCGILLGYLYDCATEKVYTWYSNEPYIFTFSAAAFDASTSYSSYVTYVFGSLLILWCIEIISKIFLRLFRRFSKIVSHDIQNILNKFNIDSIQVLDRLLMETHQVDNYHDRLFLIRKQHLIIFKINLNEHDPTILCQFYTRTPFIIIDIDSIIEIRYDRILVLDGDRRNEIWLPEIDYQDNNDRNEWLHRRLLGYSAKYRRQDAIRAQERERRHRLAAYSDEEEEIQQTNNLNDLDRIWNRITSASPRFIAQFRLEGPRTLHTQLPETKCVICLEPFLIGDNCSQWPCAAQHIFHYTCMLQVLRRQNQCPLCRHTVEAANLPSIDDMFNLVLLQDRFS